MFTSPRWGAGASAPEFAIIPQFLPVSLEGAKKTRVSIEVRNLTDGQLEFSDPRTSGPIWVRRGFWESMENIVGRKVQVPGRQSRVFYVDVASPSGVDPEQASVSIALSNNAAQTASTKMLIANQSSDLNPPPVIGCGSINPQMLSHPLIFRRRQFATSDTYLEPEILVLRVLRHRFLRRDHR